MDFYWNFYATFGILYIALTLMLGWALRTASGHYGIKVAAIVVMAFSFYYAPMRINSMLGRPIDTTPEALPAEFDLIGLDENGKQVYLWAKLDEDSPPIEYSVTFPPNKKGDANRQAMREAARGLKEAHSVHMLRDGKKDKKDGDSGVGDQEEGAASPYGSDNVADDDDNTFHVAKKFAMPAKGPKD
jgi:hypothetical protein